MQLMSGMMAWAIEVLFSSEGCSFCSLVKRRLQLLNSFLNLFRRRLQPLPAHNEGDLQARVYKSDKDDLQASVSDPSLCRCLSLSLSLCLFRILPDCPITSTAKHATQFLIGLFAISGLVGRSFRELLVR